MINNPKFGHAVQLIPAAPGWTIISTIRTEIAPIVAWALVAYPNEGKETTTAIEPAFLYEGRIYTPTTAPHHADLSDYQISPPWTESAP